MVKWIRLHAFNARGVGLIPGQGTKITYAGMAKKKKVQHNRSMVFISFLPIAKSDFSNLFISYNGKYKKIFETVSRNC